MSFLAPQAYTKETLAKAFDWLQHQPANIKQAATSPDVLVSLFLRAQRHGITSIEQEAPVSSKQFINDLENLKKDFAPFEDMTQKVPQNYVPQPAHTAPVTQQMNPQSMSMHQTHVQQPTYAPQVPQASSHQPASASGTVQLDQSSKRCIEDVQKRFNLSRPEEAVRLLISVGYRHISHWE